MFYVNEKIVREFKEYLGSTACCLKLAEATLKPSLKAEICEYKGGASNLAVLCGATLFYDIATLSGMSGSVGCTTYADPVKAEFGRSLDWTVPCNIGPYLKPTTYSTRHKHVVSHEVHGVLGMHTVESDWLCIGLNQSPAPADTGYPTAVATVAYRHRILGRLPTLVWLREWVTNLGVAIRKQGKRSRTAKFTLQSVTDMTVGQVLPISDALITGLLKVPGRGYAAFKLVINHRNGWVNAKPAISVSVTTDTPVAQANHLIVPREEDEAYDSLLREKAALKGGLKSFDAYPIYDKDICSLKIKRRQLQDG